MSCHQSDTFYFVQVKNRWEATEAHLLKIVEISTRLYDLLDEKTKAKLKLEYDQLTLETYVMIKEVKELRAQRP